MCVLCPGVNADGPVEPPGCVEPGFDVFEPGGRVGRIGFGDVVFTAIGFGAPAGPFHSVATVAVRNTTAAARTRTAAFTTRAPSAP